MARQNLRNVLWSALARWLRAWADLTDRQAGRVEHLAAETQRGDEAAGATAAERQPGEPPAHWLERAGRGEPPAHWVEHVRERAPHLLDAAPTRGGPPDVAQPLSPAQPAHDGRPGAPQPARPRARMFPLRLIPRARPTEEPVPERLAMADTSATEESAARESSPSPIAPDRQAEQMEQAEKERETWSSALRLQPRPTAVGPDREAASSDLQEAQPPPTEEEGAPHPSRPTHLKEETTLPQPQQPSRSHPQRPPVESAHEKGAPHLETERAGQPTVQPPPHGPVLEMPPQQQPREPQAALDLPPPQPPPAQEQARDREQTTRWVEFKAKPVSATPVAAPGPPPAPEQLPRTEPRPAEFRQARTEQWPQEPAKDRWPKLPDEKPFVVDDWEVNWRAWRRLQRLDREQKGHLWNESPS